MAQPLPSSLSSPVRSPRALGVLALALATALTPRAHAQTAGEKAAAAQALFDDAMRLLKAGQAAEACPKLEESQRLDPGMATQFRMAECYERVGKIASAWATFIEVADAATLAKLPDREAVARKRADALAPRLPRLILSVPPAVASVEGLEVQRDGAPVGRAIWGVPMPVDPGEHVVSARAPGKRAWEARVTAGQGPALLTVTLQPLEDLPRVVEPPQPPASGGRSAVPAIVLGSVALASVGAGIGLFVAHAGLRNDAQALSGQLRLASEGCAPAATPAVATACGMLADKARSSDALGNASTAAFAAGGGAAAAMVIYLLWPAAKPGSSSGRTLHVSPALGEGQRGVFVTGSF